MSWHSKTYFKGGGDIPFTSARIYTYWFAESWTSYFKRTRAKLTMPFETVETGVNGDANGHHLVLQRHPFFIRGIDVVEWAQQCVTSGFVSLTFAIDRSAENLIRNDGEPELVLEAKFSDKGIAALFKLTFGGK